MEKRSAIESESDGHDEDDELLMAASAWASTQNEEEEDDGNNDFPRSKHNMEKDKGNEGSTGRLKTQGSARNASNANSSHNSGPKKYSLHLTRVPFEASQGDIRFAFGEKGCHVTSVRLVYDHNQKTGEKHFRGVAFVDLADEKSFERGLEFHNKPFLGKRRKVNVRPTRTKSELSEIVRKTEEKVANLIARSKESAQTKKRERDDDGPNTRDEAGSSGSKSRKKNKKGKSSVSRPSDKIDAPAKETKQNDIRYAAKGSDGKKKKVMSKPRRESTNRNDSREESKGSDGKTNKVMSKPRKGANSSKKAGGPPVKLTKKQRAKKAAVIRSMKFRGKKK